MKNLFKKLVKKKEQDLLVIKIKDPNKAPTILYNGERLRFVSYASLIMGQSKSDYNKNMSVDFNIEHYTKQKDRMGRLDVKGFKSMR